MAFLKNIDQPTGFTTSYINIQRLISLVFQDTGASVEARLGMYKDEASRKAGSQAVQRDARFNLDDVKASIIKRVLYEAIKDEGDVSGFSFESAQDHTEYTDPDLTILVDYLADWELKALNERVSMEMETRSLSPMTESEKQAYFGE